MRFFLTIEYDGSEYIGWQRQNSGLSVQEVVENSIKKIIQINLNIYGSGRTDAGVHATGQVAHVDIITKEFEEHRLMDAINAYLLDHKIKVTDVRKTIDDAHAKSFLHHQVRNIVGTLQLVGSEKYKPEDIKLIFEKKDRTTAGPTAPACGLTLVKIEFPQEIYL